MWFGTTKLIGDRNRYGNSSSIQNGLINYEDKSFIWNKNTENELSQVQLMEVVSSLNIKLKIKTSNGVFWDL